MRRFAYATVALVAALSGCSLSQHSATRCSSDSQCATAFGAGSTCNTHGYCDELAPCTTNAECRAELGFGAVCGESGMCENATAIPRCARTYPDDLLTNPDAYRDRIVFGTLFDQSDSVHVGREHGIELGAVMVNENGDSDEPRFGLIYCDVHGGTDNPYDELSRTDAALALSTWLVETLGLPAILGPVSSTDAEAIYEQVIAPNAPTTVLMSPVTISPSLTGLDTTSPTDEVPGLLWRTAPSAADQSVLIAQDMSTRTPAIHNVAILREAGAYGTGMAQAFAPVWTARGGTYVEFPFEDGNATSRSEQITLLGTRISEFDAVYVIGQVSDSTAFMTSATANASFTDELYIYFPQGGASAAVFSGAENNRLFARVRATRPAVAETFEYLTFRDAYMARFDGLDPSTIANSPHAYDALWMTALGAMWSRAQLGHIDGLGIARGYRQLVGGTTTASFVASQWEHAAETTKAGIRMDVTGASGPLDFDLATEETMGSIELLEGQTDGTLVVID